MDILVVVIEFRFVYRIKRIGFVINNVINNVGKLIYIWSGIEFIFWNEKKIVLFLECCKLKNYLICKMIW